MQHFRPFSNLDNCRPEEAGDVISGPAVGYLGMDDRVKFGDSRSNGSRDIRVLTLFQTNEHGRSLSHNKADTPHRRFAPKSVRKDGIGWRSPEFFGAFSLLSST